VRRRRTADAAAGNAAFARALTQPERLTAESARHPLRGMKRQDQLQQRERAAGKRAEESLRPRSDIHDSALRTPCGRNTRKRLQTDRLPTAYCYCLLPGPPSA
jgi:hypothetical protein